MTPEAVITNIGTFLTALMVPAGTVAALFAVLLYGASKVMDSPRMAAWGKGAFLGAIILFGSTAAISIIKNVSSRLLGA